jgi:hypothetical protein
VTAGGVAAGDRDGLDEAVRRSAQRLSPDLYRVVTRGPVSFQHIAQARRIRQTYSRYKAESRLLEWLAEERYLAERDEAITSEYWCQKAYGGCALTSSGRLLSVLNTYVAELVVLEDSIKQLARDTERVFCGDGTVAQRTEVLESLYAVMARLMATADVCTDPATTAEAREEALSAVRVDWRLARRRTDALIQREARFEYFGGVMWGLLVALAVFAGIGALAARFWPGQIAAPAFLAATLAGSVGAVVSVVQRMASGDLVVDYTAARWQKIVVGGARPLVGGVFAAVVQFALLGGLLTMQGATTNARSTPATFAFFALTGFAAGFSERLATDILERAGATLASPQDKAVGSSAAPETAPTGEATGTLPPAEVASAPPPEVGPSGQQRAVSNEPRGASAPEPPRAQTQA